MVGLFSVCLTLSACAVPTIIDSIYIYKLYTTYKYIHVCYYNELYKTEKRKEKKRQNKSTVSLSNIAGVADQSGDYVQSKTLQTTMGVHGYVQRYNTYKTKLSKKKVSKIILESFFLFFRFSTTMSVNMYRPLKNNLTTSIIIIIITIILHLFSTYCGRELVHGWSTKCADWLTVAAKQSVREEVESQGGSGGVDNLSAVTDGRDVVSTY